MFLDEIIRECNKEVAKRLKRVNATKSSDIPIIHGRAELKLHDKAIRNKAIDDFVRFASDMPTVEEDGTIRPMRLEEIAEKLKAGGENE